MTSLIELVVVLVAYLMLLCAAFVGLYGALILGAAWLIWHGAVALLGESWTTRAPRPAFAFALPSWCWTARCACWTRPILKPAWQRWKNS